MNAYINVLKNLHFRHLWLGQITSQISLNMLFFVLAIRVYSVTGSNTAVSFMLLSFGIPAVFFGIIAGGIVDYYDNRLVMLFSNIARAVLLFSFFIFESNLFMLYILSVFVSIVTQLFIPAEAPSIPELVKPDEILTANSLFTISYYLSTVLGFLLAGPMIKILGHKNIYLFAMMVMIIASYFVFLLPKMKSKRVKTNSVLSPFFLLKLIRDGISFIKSNIRIRQSLILMTFSQVLISTLSVLAPGFADRILAIDLSDASMFVMGPAALGLVGGALWVGAYGHKYLKGTIIMFGMVGSGFCLILMSLLSRSQLPVDLIKNVYFAITLLLFLGFFNSIISVPANTILQEDSDEEIRGRVYGALTSLTGGVSLLPVVFSGMMADFMGVAKTLLIIGIIIEAASFYEFIRRRIAR